MWQEQVYSSARLHLTLKFFMSSPLDTKAFWSLVFSNDNHHYYALNSFRAVSGGSRYLFIMQPSRFYAFLAALYATPVLADNQAVFNDQHGITYSKDTGETVPLAVEAGIGEVRTCEAYPPCFLWCNITKKKFPWFPSLSTLAPKKLHGVSKIFPKSKLAFRWVVKPSWISPNWHFSTPVEIHTHHGHTSRPILCQSWNDCIIMSQEEAQERYQQR
jgi:hypothetical protein